MKIFGTLGVPIFDTRYVSGKASDPSPDVPDVPESPPGGGGTKTSTTMKKCRIDYFSKSLTTVDFLLTQWYDASGIYEFMACHFVPTIQLSPNYVNIYM